MISLRFLHSNLMNNLACWRIFNTNSWKSGSGLLFREPCAYVQCQVTCSCGCSATSRDKSVTAAWSGRNCRPENGPVVYVRKHLLHVHVLYALRFGVRFGVCERSGERESRNSGAERCLRYMYSAGHYNCKLLHLRSHALTLNNSCRPMYIARISNEWIVH